MKTIDEIAPLWSKAFDIKANKGKKAFEEFALENQITMSTYRYCVIGESHKFDMGKSVSCTDCYYFGGAGTFNFVDLYKSVETDWRDSYIVREFVKHWNFAHSDE